MEVVIGIILLMYYICLLSHIFRPEIIRDNMDALATRIDNWTVADARRFLMVTIPHQRRSSRMSRQTFERNLTRIHPMLLYTAIMGQSSHSLPPIGSNMGSYEVFSTCTCVLYS